MPDAQSKSDKPLPTYETDIDLNQGARLAADAEEKSPSFKKQMDALRLKRDAELSR